MDAGYVVVEHDLGNGSSVLVLSANGRADFLSRMRNEKGDPKRYRLIVRTVTRIMEHGENASMGTMVRMLDSSLSLVEIKVAGQVIRVMAYRGKRLVLLFDFDGHQGNSKISKKDMARGRKLAAIARKALEA